MPVYSPGPDFRPGDGYGPRPAPVPGGSTFHRGQDFPATTGTSIPSAASETARKCLPRSGTRNRTVADIYQGVVVVWCKELMSH